MKAGDIDTWLLI